MKPFSLPAKRRPAPVVAVLVAAWVAAASPAFGQDDVRGVVDAAVRPAMEAHDIPGMSVGLLLDGEHHVLHYGLASRDTGRPVDGETIFEIGSLAKPFTGALAATLAAEGRVDLGAPAGDLMDELEGGALASARLSDLATYTAGGLPLQFPDGVDETNYPQWYRDFEPVVPIGEARLYSNVSIGLFGHLVAHAAGGGFADLLQDEILTPLGLDDTFLEVPEERLEAYAQGYNRDGEPVRVNPGLFDAEAYGVKTTAGDLLRFVEAFTEKVGDGNTLAEGLSATLEGRYRIDAMHQGLGWELYGAPARLADLRQGIDPAFVLEPNRIDAASAPVADPSAVGIVSKTGSTGGFGAYALFSPERRTGIVLLANRFWPNAARLEMAHAILAALDPDFFAD